MARRTEKTVAEQIEKFKGNVSAVARVFGVRRQTMATYIERRPKLAAILNDARFEMVDNVESRFYADCLKEDPAYQRSRIFFLETIGRSRGYVRKQDIELSGPGGGPVVTEIVIEHHTAPVSEAVSGSDGGETPPADAPRPVESVAQPSEVPADPGRDALGENVVVPVVVAPRNQRPWVG